MLVRAIERNFRRVEHWLEPVLETAIDLILAEAIELEHIRKFVWSSYFGSLTDSTSVARMLLAIIADQLRSGSDFE